MLSREKIFYFVVDRVGRGCYKGCTRRRDMETLGDILKDALLNVEKKRLDRLTKEMYDLSYRITDCRHAIAELERENGRV